jgi:hypothetical protein
MSKRRAMAFVILAALIAGCAPPQPAPACGGTFAFVMTTEGVKSANLHLAAACRGGPLMLPDDAGPALDGWVSCDRADPSTFPAWSPDGSRLLYVSDYYYSGHGEVRVLDVSTRTARVLAPSYIMLDAATGQVVKQNCANPDECHFSEIRDGQVRITRRYPFHGEERIIQFSTETLEFEKYTARIEGELSSRG